MSAPTVITNTSAVSVEVGGLDIPVNGSLSVENWETLAALPKTKALLESKSIEVENGAVFTSVSKHKGDVKHIGKGVSAEDVKGKSIDVKPTPSPLKKRDK